MAAVTFNPSTQIRVIILHPETEQSSIHAHFEFVSLDKDAGEERGSHLQWEAISYKWNSSGQDQNIILDEKPYQVHDNIYRMLIALRLPDTPRRLWIDALCIDQTNDAEKQVQVQLMYQIYQEAQNVVIWLDPQGIEDETLAVARACRWMRRKSKRTLHRDLSLQQALVVDNPKMVWKNAWHEVLSHAWFTRIWVVQEATLASKLFVHLRRDLVDWDVFAPAAIRFMSLLPTSEALNKNLGHCYAITRKKGFTMEINGGLSMIYLIINLRNWRKHAAIPIPPSELALLCKDRIATDWKDMLYGIRALFDEQDREQPHSFPVDYSLDRHEIYRRFTCYCIEKENNLDILAQIRNEDGMNGSDLDSWITDWATQQQRDFQTTLTIPLSDKSLGINPLRPEYSPRVRRQGNSLIVRGFFFDELTSNIVHTAQHARPGGPESDANIQKWLSLIPENKEANELLFADSQPKQSTLEDLFQTTYQKDQFCSHLWRDGRSLKIRVRPPFPQFRIPIVTKRGCLAFTFPFFKNLEQMKACYLIGGRNLFILVPAHKLDGLQCYRLGCGDCFINGFEDGKGLSICQDLGLKAQDIHII